MSLDTSRQVFLWLLVVTGAASALAGSPEPRPEAEQPANQPLKQLVDEPIQQQAIDHAAQSAKLRVVREANDGATARPVCIPASKNAVAVSLGASHNASGMWELKVKAASDLGNRKRPLLLIDSQFEETLTDGAQDGWVVVTATTTVSGLRPAKQTSMLRERPPLEGYEHVPGLGYYKMNFNKLSYVAALRHCEADGTHLMIINSHDEVQKVLLNSDLEGWFWIGIEKLYGNEFVTVLGQPLNSTGYVVWDEKEPTEDLQCGVARRVGVLGTGNCNFLRNFVCEYEE